MPKYEITAPDGHVYEVTAPASATKQEVLNYVRQRLADENSNLDQPSQSSAATTQQANPKTAQADTQGQQQQPAQAFNGKLPTVAEIYNANDELMNKAGIENPSNEQVQQYIAYYRQHGQYPDQKIAGEKLAAELAKEAARPITPADVQQVHQQRANAGLPALSDTQVREIIKQSRANPGGTIEPYKPQPESWGHWIEHAPGRLAGGVVEGAIVNPAADTADFLGMHKAAAAIRQQASGEALTDNVMDMQPGRVVSKGGAVGEGGKIAGSFLDPRFMIAFGVGGKALDAALGAAREGRVTQKVMDSAILGSAIQGTMGYLKGGPEEAKKQAAIGLVLTPAFAAVVHNLPPMVQRFMGEKITHKLSLVRNADEGAKLFKATETFGKRLASKLPTHEEIAGRAEKLWEDRGQPEGQDTLIWHTAERQLLHEAAGADPIEVDAQGNVTTPDTSSRAALASLKMTRAQHDEFVTRMKAGQSSYDAAPAFWDADRINAPEGIQKVVDELAAVIPSEIVDGTGGVQTLREIEEGAAWLGTKTGNLRKQLSIDATGAKDQAKRFIAGKNLLFSAAKAYARQADIVKNSVDHQDIVKLFRIRDYMAGLVRDLKAIQTGNARTTSAGRIITGPIDKPEDVQKLITSLGGEDVIRADAAKVAATGGDPSAVVKTLGASFGGKAIGIANEYWINALLSGMRTIATNDISNTIQSLVMPAERIYGGLVSGDMESVKQGFRLYAGLRHYFMDSVKAAARSFEAGDNVLDARHAIYEAHAGINRLGGGIGNQSSTSSLTELANRTGQAVTGDGPHGTGWGNIGQLGLDYLGNLVRLPSRTLIASDEFFKQINYRAMVHADAVAEGLSLNKKGEDLGQYVKMVEDRAFNEHGMGTDPQALTYAQDSTFTTPLKGESIPGALNKLLIQHPILRQIQPFWRVAVNLYQAAIQRMPGVGAALPPRLFSGSLWEDLAAGGDRRSSAIGKQITGLMLTTFGAMLAAEGRITGSGPDNPTLRHQLEQTGWQPYSFRIPAWMSMDGKQHYISYRRMDPWSTIFGLIADGVQVSHAIDEKQQDNIAAGIATVIAKNITNKYFLMGLTQSMDAINKPDEYMDSFLRQRVSSLVPNIFRDFNRDPDVRKVRSVLDAVKAKIPGLSETLPPERDLFGRPTMNPRSNLFWAANPLTVGTVDHKQNSVMEEIDREKLAVSQPPKNIGHVDLTQFHNKEGQDAWDRWMQLQGEVTDGEGHNLHDTLKTLFASKDYQKLPPQSQMPPHTESLRAGMILSVVHAYREAAFAKMLQEYPAVFKAIKEDKISTATAQIYGGVAGGGKALHLGGLTINAE